MQVLNISQLKEFALSVYSSNFFIVTGFISDMPNTSKHINCQQSSLTNYVEWRDLHYNNNFGNK